MANERHLLFTWGGSYTTSELSTESWMVTLRQALVFGTIDPVGTLPNNWNVVPKTISRVETDWTITGNWKVTSGPDGWEGDDFLNDQFAPAVVTWMEAMPGLSSACKLEWIKVYPIGDTGHAIPAPPYAHGTPIILAMTGAPVVGGSGAQQLPLQIAGVISHRTAQVGRPGRGRMFVPALTTDAVNHDSTLKDTWCSTAANVQKNTLEAVAYAGAGPTGAHLNPIITGGNWTKYASISQVQVGNIPDTQRRRRRALVETRVSQPVTY